MKKQNALCIGWGQELQPLLQKFVVAAPLFQ
jgi:hypothetical protein